MSLSERGAVKVLVVDDHPIVGQALRRMLSTFDDLSVVGVATSGEQALVVADESEPHVVLMDIDMPGLDGIETTRLLRQRRPATGVVGVTGVTDPEVLERMTEAGALTVVSKTLAPARICEAVRRAAQLETGDATSQKLTPREREVARLVALGKTSKEIGQELGISPRTVDKHRATIMTKLNLRGIAPLTEWAMKQEWFDSPR